LSHPNIVPVFDWGEDEGTYFIVMELVEGRSLAEVLRGGATLTPSRTAQLAAQVAAALNYAHRNGMVHRDVKPGNILITADAQVKVTDFGIAQAMSSEDHLAEAGSVMGTATYFSPEQAEGAAVDGRSDVYSLGVVMYEMLVGRPPFLGDTPLEVSTQHVHGTVTPPTEMNSSIPRDLEAIVMKALSKSPELRYVTADELRADLLRFVDGQPVHAAGAVGAFFGSDSTQMVQTVDPRDRTQAVPVLAGPRLDVKRRRRGISAGVVWTIIAIIALAAAGAGAYELTKKHPLTVMPDLTTLNLSAAKTKLSNDGVASSRIVTKGIASSVPKNFIVRTSPAKGAAVNSSTTFTLYYSTGKPIPPVNVPTVTGLSVAAATSEIDGYKLSPSTQVATAATCNVPATAPNLVMCQSPIAGTSVPPNSTVILYIPGPNTLYAVPTVSGDTVTAAEQAISNSGMTVDFPTTPLTACSNTIQTGLVFGTSPASGTDVAAGTKIKIIQSSGGCKEAVYAVVGRLVSTAVHLLEGPGQGFVVSQVPAPATACTNPSQLNQVVYQSPSGGSPAAFGSTVTIEYCETAGTTGASGATGVTGVTGTTGATGASGTTTTTVVTTTTNPHG
jgi:serine/threonine-protein kinase